MCRFYKYYFVFFVYFFVLKIINNSSIYTRIEYLT